MTVATHQLEAIDLKSPMPLTLSLRSDDGGISREYVCLELLRVLPGRRVVARARRGQREVVLKLFLGAGGQRYRDRESAGLTKLRGTGAPTPEVLAKVWGPNVVGLVLRYLPGSKPVDPLARNHLKELAALLAHLHDKGVWQKDLHLDNFLIAHGQLYAIDGDGVRADGPTLSRRTSLRNLALLLAQLPPSADDGIAALRAAYCEARGWVDDVDTELRRLLVVVRNRRVNRYLRKTQRNCTEIEVSSSRRQNFLVLRNLDEALVTQLLSDPDRLVREGEVLKAGNSSTVIRHSSSGSGTFIIKRYNIKNPWHRLRRMFKLVTRFRRAWCNGHRLHFMQIATARPLALLEKRIGPFRGVAYLVMEDLGDRDLSREVATAGLSDARCEETAKLFALLKAIGVSHGDAKATNFMVHDDKIHLIDLDSMHPGFRRLRIDRDRFLDNWAAPERIRFEAAFQRAGLL